MRLYRVFPWDPNAAVDSPGGALFAPVSAQGRFDNENLYRGLYCSQTSEGAVGERLALLARWRATTFTTPLGKLALAMIDAPALNLVDLADIPTLVGLNVTRITQIATRDRKITQPLAETIYRRGAADGLMWWSLYVADWTNTLAWNVRTLQLIGDPELLTIEHPAVVAAANTLPRVIVRR